MNNSERDELFQAYKFHKSKGEFQLAADKLQAFFSAGGGLMNGQRELAAMREKAAESDGEKLGYEPVTGALYLDEVQRCSEKALVVWPGIRNEIAAMLPDEFGIIVSTSLGRVASCKASTVARSVLANGIREVEYELQLGDELRVMFDELVGSKIFVDLANLEKRHPTVDVSELERIRRLLFAQDCAHIIGVNGLASAEVEINSDLVLVSGSTALDLTEYWQNSSLAKQDTVYRQMMAAAKKSFS